MRVDVTVQPPKAAVPPCVVQFGFCEPMHAVLARSPSHPALPDAIDKADTGLAWPHTVHRSTAPAELPSAGRPYRWCQHLAGLDLYMAPQADVRDSSGGHFIFTAAVFMRRVLQLLDAAS